MVYNSDVAKSMLTFCKNANAPEIIQAVEGEQRAAAGQVRTTRRWLHDMGQPKSIIDEMRHYPQSMTTSLCLQPQILRIVQEDIRAFTLDAKRREAPQPQAKRHHC